MDFECIKSLDFSWQIDPHVFIKGRVYHENHRTISRTNLSLINEQGESHSVGNHWLHYKFDSFYKEYFRKSKPSETVICVVKKLS